MIRLAAIAIAMTIPTAALAEPGAAMLASSVFAAGTPRTPPKQVRLQPARTAQPPHRIVASDLRDIQAFEFRPARDYHAHPDGFGVRGKMVGFFRSF